MAPSTPLVNALTEPDAARYLGYTAAALRLWRRQGRGPAYVQVNRSIRYLPRDLDDWIARHRVTTGDTRTASAR